MKVTARILDIQYEEIKVGEKDETLRKKSQSGKFPVLETAEGHTLFESTSIARYLAR